MRTQATIAMEKLASREGQRIAFERLKIFHDRCNDQSRCSFRFAADRFIDIAAAFYVAHSPCISIPIGALVPPIID